MTLSRGIRFLSKGYIRDFPILPDTEENIKQEVLLETESNEDYSVKLACVWPENISLNASINPEKVATSTFVERFENAKSLGKNEIYKTPLIDCSSPLKNLEAFCAKIIVKFENSGEYITENKKHNFFGKYFDDYKLKFEKEDNYLFEKIFPFLDGDQIIEKYVSSHGDFLREEGSLEKAKFRIYPYSGFCEYGTHPKNMELCIFQTKANAKTTLILIHRLSALVASGINPFSDYVLKDGTPFVGIKNLQESQKSSLYDDIKNGECQVIINNIATNISQRYKSSGLTHIPGTNLITINFLRNERNNMS
ncbi:MAG: hypothetical protein LBD81_03520 [Holosporaceae bacterium]|jgi:hypothetical protein|nr:hypothetical protein [Holosporaceae bacterium]